MYLYIFIIHILTHTLIHIYNTAYTHTHTPPPYLCHTRIDVNLIVGGAMFHLLHLTISPPVAAAQLYPRDQPINELVRCALVELHDDQRCEG